MSCKYCKKVVFTNEFSGKQFFTPMKDMFGGCRGDICVAINNRGEYVLHYEDEANPDTDMVDVKIEFCPICGRKLTEEEDPELEKLFEECKAMCHRLQNALPDGCAGMLCPINLEEE